MRKDSTIIYGHSDDTVILSGLINYKDEMVNKDGGVRRIYTPDETEFLIWYDSKNGSWKVHMINEGDGFIECVRDAMVNKIRSDIVLFDDTVRQIVIGNNVVDDLDEVRSIDDFKVISATSDDDWCF